MSVSSTVEPTIVTAVTEFDAPAVVTAKVETEAVVAESILLYVKTTFVPSIFVEADKNEGTLIATLPPEVVTPA